MIKVVKFRVKVKVNEGLSLYSFPALRGEVSLDFDEVPLIDLFPEKGIYKVVIRVDRELGMLKLGRGNRGSSIFYYKNGRWRYQYCVCHPSLLRLPLGVPLTVETEGPLSKSELSQE